MINENPVTEDAVRPAPFPRKAVIWFVAGIIGFSAPAVLNAGIAPAALEWLLKGSGGHGQGWHLLGALGLCVSATTTLLWAAERYGLKQLAYLAGLIWLVIGLGLLAIVCAFVWAGFSDATGSRTFAALVLFSVVSIVSIIVGAAHRRQTTVSYHSPSFMRDWLFSIAMVVGGMFMSLLASYGIAALLVSLADHQMLPSRMGHTISNAGSNLIHTVWLTFQFGWMVPMAIRIYRFGLGQVVDAFRFAVFCGLVSSGLSFVAVFALFFLGPPPR